VTISKMLGIKRTKLRVDMDYDVRMAGDCRLG
jgi:hypothetical protein